METVHAIFDLLPTCFVQSPCSPANMVAAVKSPAVTNVMSLVIVGGLDILTGTFIQNPLGSERTNVDAAAKALYAFHDGQVRIMRTLHGSVATTFAEQITADAFC